MEQSRGKRAEKKYERLRGEAAGSGGAWRTAVANPEGPLVGKERGCCSGYCTVAPPVTRLVSESLTTDSHRRLVPS